MIFYGAFYSALYTHGQNYSICIYFQMFRRAYIVQTYLHPNKCIRTYYTEHRVLLIYRLIYTDKRILFIYYVRLYSTTL